MNAKNIRTFAQATSIFVYVSNGINYAVLIYEGFCLPYWLALLSVAKDKKYPNLRKLWWVQGDITVAYATHKYLAKKEKIRHATYDALWKKEENMSALAHALQRKEWSMFVVLLFREY